MVQAIVSPHWLDCSGSASLLYSECQMLMLTFEAIVSQMKTEMLLVAVEQHSLRLHISWQIGQMGCYQTC